MRWLAARAPVPVFILQGTDAGRFTVVVDSLTAVLGPLAAVAGVATTWWVLVPSGMRVRTVYEGRESSYDGPCHVTQRDPVSITVGQAVGDWSVGDWSVGDSSVGDGSVDLVGGPVPGSGVMITTRSTPEPSAPAPASHLVVGGVRCDCGTFANPRSLRCPGCRQSLDGRASTQGPRPSLGTLVVDNATSHPLDTGYVLGRDAASSPLVTDGQAVALDLRDVGRALSRIHTTITLEGWDVFITDHGSANGTTVRPPDGWRWQQLVPEVGYRLLPHSEVRVGNHVLRFDGPGAAA